MNSFIFIVHGYNGQIYNGICKAPGGSDARQKINEEFTRLGIKIRYMDFVGITSASFQIHNGMNEAGVFQNMLLNGGLTLRDDDANYGTHEFVMEGAAMPEHPEIWRSISMGAGGGDCLCSATFYFDERGKLCEHAIGE